jgi:D-cysteine desulfhydrase
VTVHDVTPQEQDDLLQQTADALRAEGAQPYLPQLDAHLGAVAYFDCALELIEQLATLPRSPRALYLAAAGETHAGLLLGLQAAGCPLPVVGVNPGVGWWDVRQRIHDLAERAADELGIDSELSDDELTVLALDGDPGYGYPAGDGLAALDLVARCEGLLLDPVYTSKAMAVLIEHARGGQLPGAEGPVVFLHTGGAPALFHYRDILTAPAAQAGLSGGQADSRGVE